MNIVMVLPYLKAGGTERQASYIVNDLIGKGNNVLTISIEYKNQFEPLFKGPVRYLKSSNHNVWLLFNVVLLVRQIKQFKPDILISRAWNTNLLCVITSLITKVPSVVFLSGSIDLSHHSRLKRWIHRFVMSHSARIISVSKASKVNCMKWLNVPDEKIVVIQNGVDPEELSVLAEEPADLPEDLITDFPTVVFVGRLNHRKGVDVLLHALSKVIEAGKKVNLLIVGHGEAIEEYVDLKKKLNLEPFVYFVGEKQNPFPYIKFGDIFVLPSRSEGFPNVLLEAMALNKAVIASNCKTGPNEIIDGENGTLVAVEDSNMLCEKIISYLDDSQLSTKHAENAKNTITFYFNLEIQLNKVESVLKLVNRENWEKGFV